MKEKNEMLFIAFLSLFAIAIAAFNMVSVEKLEEQVKALQEVMGEVD